MLIKTHLAIAIFSILFLIPYVEAKLVFSLVALIVTFVPDVDEKKSSLGKYKIFRTVQMFLKHRGVLHSFTFLILVSLALALFFPVIALGFFVGYGAHLLADSFTIEGIKPFYPSKKVISGKIRTGSRGETGIFVFFVLADVFLVILRVFG
jgi:membrane-bound metal-dependent hydrolase YbcI (DUF457 family)